MYMHMHMRMSVLKKYLLARARRRLCRKLCPEGLRLRAGLVGKNLLAPLLKLACQIGKLPH